MPSRDHIGILYDTRSRLLRICSLLLIAFTASVANVSGSGEFLTEQLYLSGSCSTKPLSDKQRSALVDARKLVSGYRERLGDLTNTDFGNINLTGVRFDQVNLKCADLSGANLTRVDLTGANLTKANLSNANLTYADLSGANLTEADLSVADLTNAQLFGANLTKADLSFASLTEANLLNADLTKARLHGANLTKANLTHANLTRVDLTGANLTKAHLYRASLTEADLSDANLTKADLFGANLAKAKLVNTTLANTTMSLAILQDVTFEAQTISIDLTLFRDVKGLATLQYINSRQGLAALRQLYEKSGMREQEREVTYALKHSDRLWSWRQDTIGDKIESIFNWVFFEWPSAYGLYPGKPLWTLVASILLFTIPYMFALKSGKGIKMVWPEKIRGDDDPFAQADKSFGARPQHFFPQLSRKYPQFRALINILAIIVVSFYFSLLSTFHIGWRELSLGPWLSRIQPREYSLVPVGWVRVVTGIQSILSVYLIALWALTYFGRPFE